ncbi:MULTISPECIES: hypothetical protein [Streptomyces]|uniref:Uncharacterized protein n=1 Tax=Streptomyces achmelvichensis TaxID=3134111 RepID=A0ACC6PMT3_9ACTN|nr:hypothetical protein OG317_00710 [Streptomyces sp. NBC_01167]
MDTHADPEQPRHDAIAAGPPIRQLFRDVIADRLTSRRPCQAAMQFDAEIDPYWEDDRSFRLLQRDPPPGHLPARYR